MKSKFDITGETTIPHSLAADHKISLFHSLMNLIRLRKW